MRVALVGYTGYWGKKLERCLRELDHQIFDKFTSRNIRELEDTDADCVFIASPPDTHYEIAMRAMKLGMDVLVEKPMTMRGSRAEEMAKFAKEKGVILSVDSTLLFTEAFEFLNNLGQSLVSYQSIRLSLPMPQAKINAAWDLVVHDLSILDGFRSLTYGGQGMVDGSVAVASLPLRSGGSAFIMASRAWPEKVRGITLHFSKESYFWKLDGLYHLDGSKFLEEKEEPLKRMIENFDKRCQERQIAGLTDGDHGARVCSCIEKMFPLY